MLSSMQNFRAGQLNFQSNVNQATLTGALSVFTLAAQLLAMPALPPRDRPNLPKPRNLVGLAKDLPVPKMEALLMAHQSATEAMAAELATQRGEAVRAHLVAQNLPAERVALAAPKAGTQPEKWTPRAELSLDRQ